MKERFQGCLLGVALGDALGAPAKGLTKEEIQTQRSLPVRAAEAIAHGHDPVISPQLPWKLAGGTDIDDCNLMMLTLESICTQRSIKTSDMVRCLKGFYRTHPQTLTPLTAHVLSRLNEGERWEEASEGASLDSDFNPPDGGNLPRTIPVGLYRARNIEKLVADTIEVSRLTHWDDRATHSAVAINYLITRLAQNDKQALNSLDTFLADKNAEVRGAVKKGAEGAEADLDTSGLATSVVAVAVWTLKNAPSFLEGLEMVINLGGQTDLNAAVAGSLLGAKFGRLVLPEAWMFQLEGKVRVEVLANRLYEHALNG